MMVGVVLAIIVAGYLVWAWFVVWTLVRCTKGIVRVTDGQPIESPTSLLR